MARRCDSKLEMHDLVSFDRQLIFAREASLPALGTSSLYGKGIFTTIAIYNAKPFLWEKHWRRLRDNAEKVNISLENLSEKSTRDALDGLVAANNVIDGRARITFFDESPGAIWPFDGE